MIQNTYIFLVITMRGATTAHAASLTPVVIIVAGRIDMLVGGAPGVAAGEVARVVLIICRRDKCNLQTRTHGYLSCLNFVPLEFYHFFQIKRATMQL